ARGGGGGGLGAAAVAAAVIARRFAPGQAGPAARAPAARIEHGEGAVEALQHHLRRIAVLAVLALPLARLQRPFKVDLRALFQVLLHHPAQALVEDNDRMPLGLFAALACRLVAPGLGGGNAQVGNGAAVLRAPDLRILAQIANENHLIDGTGHAGLLSLGSLFAAGGGRRISPAFPGDVSGCLTPALGLQVACPRFARAHSLAPTLPDLTLPDLTLNELTLFEPWADF